MRNQILVFLDKGLEFHFNVGETPPMPHDVARAWLDAQFTALDCEPLRASGKLLTVDKVLRVTQAAGQLGDVVTDPAVTPPMHWCELTSRTWIGYTVEAVSNFLHRGLLIRVWRLREGRPPAAPPATPPS